MADTLTILGASVRAAAQSAVRARLEPYAIDLFADRDLAAICPAVKIERYPADFEPALADAPPSPWLYTGGLENHPRLIERLAALRPLLGNRGRNLKLVRSPDRLSAAADAAGCRFPRWTSGATTKAGWLLKPKHSSGGQSIRWASADYLPATSTGVYSQQHIAGQSASAVYVAAGGRAALLGATRQLLGSDFGLARPFVYAGSIGPLPLSLQENERLVVLGNVLAERFQLQGLFNVDFIRNDAGLWVLEVNPRYSASVEVLERITGVPFLGLHVAACQQQELPASEFSVSPPFLGKAVVYADRECSVSRGFDELVEAWNSKDESPAIADLPGSGQKFAAGDPVATVIAAGVSDAAVENELHSRIATVLRVLRTEY